MLLDQAHLAAQQYRSALNRLRLDACILCRDFADSALAGWRWSVRFAHASSHIWGPVHTPPFLVLSPTSLSWSLYPAIQEYFVPGFWYSFEAVLATIERSRSVFPVCYWAHAGHAGAAHLTITAPSVLSMVRGKFEGQGAIRYHLTHYGAHATASTALQDAVSTRSSHGGPVAQACST